jgi:diadenosine tetraphosphate (Ap4A) HIT family hydrolase
VPCAFCDRIASGDLAAENDLAVAFFDAYAVTPGHCLIRA